MKQLLIVSSTAALNGGAAKPTDLAGMTKGALGVYEIATPDTWLAVKPKSNFAIVIGGGPRVNALIIPEVNIANFTQLITDPAAGNVCSMEFTVPAVAAGKTYTAILTKKGVTFNEHNKYIADVYLPSNSSKTSADVAASIGAQFTAKANAGSINVNVVVAGSKVTITGISTNENFGLVLADDLSGVAVTYTAAKKTIGDKAYVTKLAQDCIGDRGMEYLYGEGKENYPGYPIPVEDDNYTIITLRYKNYRRTGLCSGDATDMVTHIAVPSKSAALATIKTIFGYVAPVGG